MRRDCPVQAKTAEHGDHVKRAVTGDESVAIARGCDGIADYLLLGSLISAPWQLYLTLSALAGGGANCLAYTGIARAR